MASKIRAVAFILLFLGLIASVIKVGGSFVLGRLLTEVFSRGTGCAVTLEDPELVLVPFGGRIHNVHIVCANENQNEGVRSETISVRLLLADLLQKRVELRDLFLRGTSVISRSRDSSFLRLMNFLFHKREPIPNDGTWRSKFTSGWGVHVLNVDITTAPKSRDALILSANSTNFLWNEVHFSSADPRKEDPVEIAARGTDFRVQSGKLPAVWFGRVQMRGGLLHGILDVKEAIVDDAITFADPKGESVGSATGAINFRGDGQYGLTVLGEGTSAYWGHVLPSLEASLATHPFSNIIRGRVTGAILAPELDADVDVHFDSPVRVLTKKAHDVHELHAHVQADVKKLSIAKLAIPELLDNAAMELALSGEFPIQLTAESSEFSLQAQGTLQPVLLSSQLRAKYLPAGAAGPVRIGLEQHGEEFRFALDDHIDSNVAQKGMSGVPRTISCVVTYDRKQRALVNLKADAVGYPLIRVTSWALPFAGTRAAELFFSAVNEESLFDTTLSLTGENGGLVGNGFIALSNISPLGMPLTKFATASIFDAKGVALKDIQITSDAGPISGTGTVHPHGVFQLNLMSQPFGLRFDLQGGEDKLKASLAVHELPLSLLGFEAPGERRHQTNQIQQSAGTANVVAEYSGPNSNFLAGKGFVRIENIILPDGTNIVAPQNPLLVEIENDRGLFKNVQLKSSDKTLALTGYVDSTSGWHATLRGRWELSQMVFRRLPLEQLSGLLDTSLTITGPALHPEVGGTFTVHDSSISLPLGGNFVGASDVSISANLAGNNLTFDRLTANVGDGKVVGSGRIDNVLPLRSARGQVDLTLNDIVLEPISRLVVQGSGTTSLIKVPDEPLTIKGDIGVSSATYEDTVDIRQLIKLVTEKLSGTVTTESQTVTNIRSGAVGNTVLDFQLHAQNGIVLETNIAEAELSGNLHFRGTAAEIGPEGALQAISGAFMLGANRFEITSGTLLFPNRVEGRDPQIDLVGEATVTGQAKEDHRIRVSIVGNVANPQVRLSSDTGLREQQIVSLLGIGANLGKVSFLGFKPGSGKSVAELLSPVSGVSATERVTGLTEFSDVSIDSYTSPITGEVTPRINARRPIIGGLDLRLSSELSAEQYGTAQLEYPLTDTLDLTGGWATRSTSREIKSSSGAFNAGVRYRKMFPGLTLVPQWFSQSKEAPTQ